MSAKFYSAQPYFQPNFSVYAKIRLIRISAEKCVQPAEFLKNTAEGSDAVYLNSMQLEMCQAALLHAYGTLRKSELLHIPGILVASRNH